MDLVQLSEIVRNFALSFVALVGICLAWMRVTAASRQADASLEQAELARRDHVAELFNRAVGQLPHEKLEVRLGAVYTLQQIAQDFPDLSKSTFELLSAYLRESVPDYGDKEPPIDVREIMRMLKDQLVQR
ncbi:MAG TPA: hypothetical protein VF913_00580 [Xanthobacteraceae bacterium]